MAQITTLEVGASCVAHAAFFNAAGASGNVQGVPAWAIDNAAGASITPSGDGMTASITRNTADPVNVTLTAQSITSGAPDIVATAALPLPAVVANPAVSASITFEDS